MHQASIDKVNGMGVMFRFITPFLSVIGGILSGIVLMYLSGLKADLYTAKLEAKSNFDKLQVVAQLNFDKIEGQYNAHILHHQSFDKEICERLARVETLISQRIETLERESYGFQDYIRGKKDK